MQSHDMAMAGFATAATVGSSGLNQINCGRKDTAGGVCSLAPGGPETELANVMKPKPKESPAGSKGVVAARKAKVSSKVTDKLRADAGRVGEGGIPGDSTVSVTGKKPRKPRVKKDKVESQSKIKKGRITKPGTGTGKAEAPVKRKRSSVTGVTVMSGINTGIPEVVEHITTERDLGLDKAVVRRQCWTPPKETARLVEGTYEKTGFSVQTVEASHLTFLEPSVPSLGTLFSNYGYANSHNDCVSPQVVRNVGRATATKRRKIEVSPIHK